MVYSLSPMAEKQPRRRASGAANPEPEHPRRQPAPREVVRPETRHAVLVVIVLTFAAVLLLSVFGWADTFGDRISDALGTLVGWQRFLVPFYGLWLGIVLLFPERWHITGPRWLGFTLTLLGSLGLMHMAVPLAVDGQRAIEGVGGGYIGFLVSHVPRSSLGPWAGGLVLAAMLIIGLLILFNATLQSLYRRSNLFNGLTMLIRRFRWQRRLATIQSETVPAPEFQATEVPIAQSETDEPNAGEPAEAVDEPDMVPLPVKKERRPKRQITIPMDLLDLADSKPTSGNIELNKDRIKKTLENFGISVEMDEIHVGPTVTQYTLKPADGVRLAQIASLKNDMALALAAHPIRIEAPIPGKSLVGIEVPNQSIALVTLRDILDTEEFRRRKSDLSFSLGKDVSGQPWVANLELMPHLLIAGATGSGKSVQINGLIISLLYSNSPDDLKLILVDPKRVELSLYNDIPHLLTPVITETTKTINALRWVVSEMDRRYQVLQNARKRNIAAYRQDVSDDMPYICVVIDELADLMSVAANDVEGMIVRLAQMARAVGIHLILATQRPSVDVITGLIKANITARVAFSVASQIDSRTILDMAGAESLLGKGDMLFISAELSKPKRLQGAYVSEAEVERVTSYLKARGKPDYMAEVTEKQPGAPGQGIDDLGEDELLPDAKEVIVQSGRASTTLLQRRLRVGYARAARIMDLLEKEGFIGPGEGAKPREIYGRSTEHPPFAQDPRDLPTDTGDDVPLAPEEEIEDEEPEDPATTNSNPA